MRDPCRNVPDSTSASDPAGGPRTPIGGPVVRRTFDDVSRWDASAFRSEIHLVQLAPGRFQSRQTLVDLAGVQVLRVTINQPVNARGAGRNEAYAAVFFRRSQRGHYCGGPIDRQNLVLLRPFEDFDACAAETAFESTAVFVSPHFLQPYARMFAGRDVDLAHRRQLSGRPAAARLQRLAACTNRVLALADRHPNLFHQPEIGPTLRDEVLTRLLATLDSIPDWSSAGSCARAVKPLRLVRLAEEYVLDRPEENVRLLDLCQVTGVSERTLQYAFREVLGVSPVTYLARLRLHKVRQSLLEAPPGTTVSAAACRWGFWHFGEFARAYKQFFGELPSATLHGKRRTK